jgi:acetoin utilization deacetylase AcuC-like enzyme
MESTLLVFDERCLAHETPYDHPESPRRLRAIVDSLSKDPIPGTAWAPARPATREELLLVHREAYVDRILGLRGRSTRLDYDTWLSTGSVDAALLAAGATVEAARALCEGRAKNAFALVRPPGHHAESDRAMGFCIFNNAAIAAAVARAHLGRERILVVDWDVHHGNGTQEMFWTRSDVLYFSTHRSPPFYPQTGRLEEVGGGEGRGFSVNLPLPGGTRDDDFVALYRGILEPIAADFHPDLVIVSAGFDAHRDDPLGGMGMSAAGFSALTAIVRGIAERDAGGRLLLVLEGGYDLQGLAAGVRACLEVMTAEECPPPPRAKPGPETRRLLQMAGALHAETWPSLR